jgi:hypothetical protein
MTAQVSSIFTVSEDLGWSNGRDVPASVARRSARRPAAANPTTKAVQTQMAAARPPGRARHESASTIGFPDAVEDHRREEGVEGAAHNTPDRKAEVELGEARRFRPPGHKPCGTSAR